MKYLIPGNFLDMINFVIRSSIIKLLRKIHKNTTFRDENFPNYTLLGVDKNTNRVIVGFDEYWGQKGRINNTLVTKLNDCLAGNETVLVSDTSTMSGVRYRKWIVTVKRRREKESGMMDENDLGNVMNFVSDERSKARDVEGKDIISTIRINGIYLNDGRVAIACNDEYTHKWIKQLEFGSIKGHKYMIFKEGEKLIRCCIKVLTKPGGYSPTAFKDQMVRGNPEIKIKGLVFDKSEVKDNGESSISFSVDRTSYESMRAKNFEVFFDFTKTQVKRIE